jgi:hypothetical protein
MAVRVEKHIDILKVLNYASMDKRKHILRYLENEGINLFGELVHNILKGVVPLSTRQKVALIDFKTQLKSLSKKKVSSKTKRELLVSNPRLVKLIISPVLAYFTKD